MFIDIRLNHVNLNYDQRAPGVPISYSQHNAIHSMYLGLVRVQTTAAPRDNLSYDINICLFKWYGVTWLMEVS